MVGWHHQLSGQESAKKQTKKESVQTLGDSEGKPGAVHGVAESQTGLSN